MYVHADEYLMRIERVEYFSFYLFDMHEYQPCFKCEKKQLI